jgi:uncharacterized coiled-coil protein SlyX
MSSILDSAILEERESTFAPEELELLLDEDESKLEERERALSGIRTYIASRFVQFDRDRQSLEPLLERMDALERNVKTLRRKCERINFLSEDGWRIFEMEVVRQCQ